MLNTTIERFDPEGLITRIALDDGRDFAAVNLRIDRTAKFGETFGILRNRSGSIDEPVCSQGAARLLILAAERAPTVRQAVTDWVGDYRDKD